MALSEVHLLKRKLAWVLLMMEGRKGLIQLVMILVMNLYWVLQRPMGMKFLREVALLYLGIRQRQVELTISSILKEVKVSVQNFRRGLMESQFLWNMRG